MAHKTPTNRDYRKFGLFLAALFLLIGLVPLWRHDPPRWWAVAVAGVLILAALAFPVAIRPLFKLSLKVGGVIGWVNTRILLSAIFYLIFTPVGLVMRMRRGGAKWSERGGQPSYWHGREKVDMEKQMRHLF